jgi:autotransporter-associated beta strand protein
MNNLNIISNGRTLRRSIKSKSSSGLFLALLSLFSLQSIQAGSATWNLNPISGDWNTATNWMPNTVPNGPADTAAFGASNTINVSLSAATEVDSIVYSAGASAFTISPTPGTTLILSGAGVTNNSGVMQNVVIGVDTNFNHAFLTFSNNATAGSLTTYTNKAATINTYGGTTILYYNSNAGSAIFITEGGTTGNEIVGGVVDFWDNSSASNATFITGGGTTPNSNGGEVGFFVNSSAANATFINNPATALDAQGGFVEFENDATAAEATFINNGSSAPRNGGGVTAFYDTARAGHCTLIANGGTNGGQGGGIWFFKDSFGDFAQVKLFGNGLLDLSSRGQPGVTIGSLEGDGVVFMGPFALAIGSNNLSTTFSGRITDSSYAGGGPLRKVGSGTLVLTGASNYIGGTTIRQGKLEVSNRHGSGTGTGPVQVRGGRLTGRGTIAGAVTVATESGSAALLAPGRGAGDAQTLTIESNLGFNPGATYRCDVNSDFAKADQVVANGVTIADGAQFSVADSGSVPMPSGTTFTVISNTAATPIFGTFSNLADEGIVSVGENNFQANYEGGDGNDLTLTVVP